MLFVLLLILTRVSAGVGQAAISLVETEYVVQEGEQFAIRVRKSGVASSAINAVIQLQGAEMGDFVGSSGATVFPAGTDDVIHDITFTVLEDPVPEKDEIYYFELGVTNGHGTVASPHVGRVTIIANDGAFGVFGFASIASITTNELSTGDNFVQLAVHRRKGSHDTVVLSFQVLALGKPLSGDDIEPNFGNITFYEGETVKPIVLSIKDDLLPEDDETYMVRLVTAEGGNSIHGQSNRPSINSSLNSVQITIKANDAPVRFQQDTYRVDEKSFQSSIQFTILRGESIDGNVIGPINRFASVDYYVCSVTAENGIDYVASNGSIGFAPGTNITTLSVDILSDNIPEVAETFKIVLGDITGDAVLTHPHTATVIINANDDYNGVISFKVDDINLNQHPVIRINEDSGSSVATFVLIRNGGSFGEISVQWKLTREDGSDVHETSHIVPIFGVATFPDNIKEQTIAINVLQDTVPESAERYFVLLLEDTVIGGGRIEGLVRAELILEDSDLAHGVIQFTDDTAQAIITSATPRRLSLTLVRNGGSLGYVNVHFAAVYVDPTENSTQDIFMVRFPTITTIPEGESSHTFEIHIKSEAFLAVGGYIKVEIENVEISGDVTVGPYNTPSVGSKLSVTLPVTEEAANGEVGFESTEKILTEEPEDGTSVVTIQVKRVGTSGSATVYWSLQGSGIYADHLTQSDVQPMNGVITMVPGQSSVDITVEILPDNVAETEEEMTLTLLRVEPTKMQRLRHGFNEIKLVIPENDNAGGIFQFSPSISSVYSVREELDPIEISVLRTGGTLVGREIEYYIEPYADEEFYGATNVMKFKPGEVEKSATILAKRDGVAELTEHFYLKLRSFGTGPEAIIAQGSVINITVYENENPYGKMEFEPNSVVFAEESKENDSTIAEVHVLRTMGRFGTVTVDWYLEQDAAADLQPLFGTLLFEPGVGTKVIELNTIADNLPEEDESFNLTLIWPTNGAVLGDVITTTIVILKNDDAVYFKYPIFNKIFEGESVTLTVLRDGNASEPASVKYRTVDGTATLRGFDYEPLDHMEIFFNVGENRKDIVVHTLPDDEPETDELFFVTLYDAIGDIAVYGNPNATVVIAANDNANGVFSFKLPLERNAVEGKTVPIELIRAAGHFGEVYVHWEIRDVTTRELIQEEEFVNTTGVVMFGDLQETGMILLTPTADGVPEYDEKFVIHLTNVTGGGPSGESPLLDDTNLEAIVMVLQNDDPYGVFSFDDNSRDIQIAEDFSQGNATTAQTSLRVNRKQGTFGTIKVTWEAFSHQIAGAGNLPMVLDVFLVATPRTGMKEIQWLKRSKTGTLVYGFDGCMECYLEVAPAYHIPPSEISDGFSISAWVQVPTGSNGYVLAKTSHDASRQYYAMRLSSSLSGDVMSATIEFRYSVPHNNNNLVVAKVVAVDLGNSYWHHIVLALEGGVVSFYVDGKEVGTSNLEGSEILDGDGLMYVGTAGNTQNNFEGVMQDLRIFTRKLDAGEIKEMFEEPSKNDIEPISGYITFQENEDFEQIQISSVDDQEEETNDVFAIKLISVTGGARIGPQSTAILTVLKSDNANGLFGFSGGCTSLRPALENTTIECPVERQRGDSDSVFLEWRVLGSDTDEPAHEDFLNASGVVEFLPGERHKTVTVYAIDDTLPEVAEYFRIVLASVTSGDGVDGTTPTSGASTDLSANVKNISLAASDSPHGLFEFAVNNAPPEVDSSRIAPATEQPEISIEEETGVLTLMVVRAQGLLGRVSVEFRTRDGTAQSFGKTYPDYTANVGRLTFEPFERYKYINITILDNLFPESSKYFDVELLNPSDGAEVGVGSIIRVEIQHSDFAHGVFNFHKNSQKVYATESLNTDLSIARFKIIREGGAISSVNLTWRVTFDPNDDLTVSEGIVEFANGQTEAEIEVSLRDDRLPELDEVFLVRLTNLTKGIIGQAQTAELVIDANDDPYGVFIISHNDRLIYTEEEDDDLVITIERQPASGHYGEVRVHYTTLLPTETYTFLPGTSQRAGMSDYNSTIGYVIFEHGVRAMTFNVSILDDVIPEVDESVFVRLVGVELVRAEQDRPVTDSPKLGPSMDIYSQIVIAENDDARGVFELPVARISVDEDVRGSFIDVKRRAGTFGSVNVKFEVIQGTATYGLDYSVTSTDIVFASGEKEKSLPIEIRNDALPEMQETFKIRLLDEVVVGARLGEIRETTVTIKLSDDPHGAFGFETESSIVTEPGPSELRTVAIPVIRIGGTLGVVAVEWKATIRGEIAEDDVRPSSGTVHFVSNVASENIIINVLQDDLPEGAEDVEVHLISVSNGGRILADRNSFVLSISANDNPHGTLGFSERSFMLEEPKEQTLQYVPVTRNGGNFGQLRVYYSIKELDLLEEIQKTNNVVLDFYFPPKSGKPLSLPSTPWNVQGQPHPKLACASFCLLTQSCEAFEYHEERIDCNWYTSRTYDFLANRTGYAFYIKDTNYSSLLYNSQATSSLDFLNSQRQTLIIEDGAAEGFIPVQILPDTLPELEEKLVISLLGVELIGDSPRDPNNSPQLGDHTEAYVVIRSNDDANGVFRIYSNDVRAMNDGQLIEVEERNKLSVELVVERQGGSIGSVSVGWRVNDNRTTATKGIDYVADGALLQFDPGLTQRVITIGVEDDELPEDDEIVVIDLYNALGGAGLAASQHSTAVVVIKANDHVAGLFGFQRISFLAREGDVITLTVERSEPGIGRVTVNWEIMPVGSGAPAERFRTHTGSLFFDNNELEKQFTLYILVDNEPKINQEYHVTLTDIYTEGVRETGAAAVDPDRSVSVVTIEGGNEPHGVFSFLVAAAEKRVREDEGTVYVPVHRKFGSIGSVKVSYEVRPGSLTPPGDLLEAALPADDFTAYVGEIITYDGENSAAIPVNITNDDDPEIDEVFLIQLLSVELIDGSHSTFQPRLDTTSTTAEIIIAANDGTQGKVIFPEQYTNITVEELRQDITLMLHRTKGTFGAVSVFCFAQNAKGGAVRGEDFLFEPMDIHFGPGVSEQIMSITILEDILPEPDETFEIVLASPKNGLRIGNPGKAVVVISANDEASGVVSFLSAENITLVEPRDDQKNDIHSKAKIAVTRVPGAFGVVTVPFIVTSADGKPVTDLSPKSGNVIFQDQQSTAVLQISVVPDSIPEEVETYTVTLQTPDGGATLGQILIKNIIIERNDAPYGKLTVYPSATRESSIDIEEDNSTIYFDVVRESGSMGWVSVDLLTSSASARTQDGNRVHISHMDRIAHPGMGSWCPFTANDLAFAVYLQSSYLEPLSLEGDVTTGSVVYAWQGALTQRQTLETDGASSCTSFVIDGTHYIFITNAGKNGRRETLSNLYRVTAMTELFLVQSLRTKGATSASFYQQNEKQFLFVTNYINSLGSTDVDSFIFQWDNTQAKFSSVPVQYLNTNGAVHSKIIHVGNELFLLVINHYDSRSQSHQIRSVIYKLDANAIWNIHQQLATMGAVDAECFHIGQSSYIAIANNRNDAGEFEQTTDIYVWNKLTMLFQSVQRIPTTDVQTVKAFIYRANVYLTVANKGEFSAVYTWDVGQGQFFHVWSGPASNSFQPLLIDNAYGDTEIFFLLNELSDDISMNSHTSVYQMSLLGESDYIERQSTIWFSPNQTDIQIAVNIVDDDLPEDTETFNVELRNPRHGAELGLNHTVFVNILSNDNGHGVIHFAQDSIERFEEELVGKDNTISFNVIRSKGTNGHVIVRWRLTGEHNGIYDISPVEGLVEFADGQAAAMIVVNIQDDGLPEADEVTYITLDQVLQSGTSLEGRGAKIGVDAIAKLTVMASDSPYGVVAWETLNHVISEPEGTDTRISLQIIREQGTLGSILISYMTERAVDLRVEEQAISGKDYVTSHSFVEMASGVTRAEIDIAILADLDPEIAESFYVNITSAQLLDEEHQSRGDADVSVSQPRRVAMVTIPENDNARGILEFDVIRNAENRIDVFEGISTIQLTVARSIGHFGEVEVTWEAFPREAELGDFQPATGIIRFEQDDMEAYIEIDIVDDAIPENMETFDVHLRRVKSGGAALGSDNRVRIGILKNDSPNGVFSFLISEKSVKESTSLSDPQGVVSFDIVRRGTDGEVSVQWRLEAGAVGDFQAPLAGTVLFKAGETQKTISLRTKPDDILEGQEHFVISLISADNNGDISPTAGDATVVILADESSSGLVRIVQDQPVYMGEPSANYDGTSFVMLDRGVGIFGEVEVTWHILPRDANAFMQTQGVATFNDLQQNTSILIHTRDDSIAEIRSSYTLELTSATGGASIDQSARSCDIVYVASDYPHGLFEFSQPIELIAYEGQGQVSVIVKRNYGQMGVVTVHYTTSAGTADGSQDFVPTSGSLRFLHEQTERVIQVDIVDDDASEGPEHFFVNLTSAERAYPDTNDYSIVNGLQLDMAPAIGPLAAKVIVIDKNDNAEGIIEFKPEAVNFIVREETGRAEIPITRLSGTWGAVDVSFSIRNGTAVEGVDFKGTSGSTQIQDGQADGAVVVAIVDDNEREYDETFLVVLTGVSEDAQLGALRTSTVTIAKSDYPNGKFSFLQKDPLFLNNPERALVVPVTVERTEGVTGRQTLKWRIIGPNNPNRVLEETHDIAYVNGQGQEVTRGQLVWNADESGPKSFSLVVKPYTGWETAEMFIIIVYDLQGFPANLGSGEMDESADNFTITIQKYGDPNGIVRFNGEAQLRRVTDEPDMGSQTVVFPITRREGTLGDIEIYWSTESVHFDVFKPDIRPYSGSITILSGRRDGQIDVDVLADDIAELNETFKLVLKSIQGGAEIDTEYNSSEITIRCNDEPHGRFGIPDELQTVVVSSLSDMKRRLRLNITRFAGNIGRVRIGFAMQFDQANTGVSYLPSTGSVTFNDSQGHAVVYVDLESDIFLPLRSTFKVTLTVATYIGADMTSAPVVDNEYRMARVEVPPEAANSQVGFQSDIFTVDEDTSLAEIRVERLGSYGRLQVAWTTGLTESDSSFEQGGLSPDAGVLIMDHGQDLISFNVQVLANSDSLEQFGLQLSETPVTAVGGGAGLKSGSTSCKIDPFGVIQFSADSRTVAVEESPTGEDVQVTLKIERKYGSANSIQVRYHTVSGSAVAGTDFDGVEDGSLTMAGMQTSALIYVTIKSDNLPETDEDFFVNITSVTLLPTAVQKISPRISNSYSSAAVTISSNSDPYGVLSLEVTGSPRVSEPGAIDIVIRRTKGTFGEVHFRVRSVGGGEPWDSIIATTPGASNDTIGQALGNRDLAKQAAVGEDYQLLDATLKLLDGEGETSATLYVLDDTSPEDDEHVFVFITPETQSVRVALPGIDNGHKGFVALTIERNDYWSGWIGFYNVNSSSVAASEDLRESVTLTIERRNASFGAIQVYWRAVLERGSDAVKNDDIDLTEELSYISSKTECESDRRYCEFHIPVLQDTKPENETVFYVELTRVSSGAEIDEQRRYAKVTLTPSDHPHGLLQFSPNSRYVYANRRTIKVILHVERLGHGGKRLTVNYRTLQYANNQIVAGVEINTAVADSDFISKSGTLVFSPGEEEHTIEIILDLNRVSLKPYPKSFRIVLSDVSNSGELGQHESIVTIVADGEDVWKTWAQTQNQALTNATIDNLMAELRSSLRSSVSAMELDVTRSTLDKVLDVAQISALLEGTKNSIMDVFCGLLRQSEEDATRGEWRLAQQLERFAFTYVSQYPCDECCTDPGLLIQSPECSRASFRVAKWYPDDINGYRFAVDNQDHIKLPDRYMSLEHGRNSDNPKCFPVVFVEYSSQQWFEPEGNEELLNSRVISVTLQNQPSRELDQPVVYKIHSGLSQAPPSAAQCVYFDEGVGIWTSGNGLCEVSNNLDLAVDNFVECSCKHMSHYGVKVQIRDPNKIGYPIWFHVTCFICIAGVSMAIVCHHFCSFHPMFASNLLMHMLFSVFATELCYLINVYLSPDHLLDINNTGSNYRCITMALFTHYFFVAQFTWMFTQALNFHRILILNDERTERKYVYYFLLGWGLPAIIITLFYISAYLIYRFVADLPVDQIYGDVHQNRDICFITEPLAGLAGVILPALLFLMVVGFVFIQAYQVAPQWQAYDDVYRGRHNQQEVRVVLLFWGCVTLTWLWGGLHLAYSHAWMLVLFCLFNIATGLFAFIAYAAVRNPCIPYFRPQKEAAYSLNPSNSDVNINSPYDHMPPAMPVSKDSLVANDQNWEVHSLAKSSQLKVKRNAVTGTSGNVYVIPPSPVRFTDRSTTEHTSVSSNFSTDASNQSAEMDDLISALRSRSYTGSVTSQDSTDHQGQYSFRHTAYGHPNEGGDMKKSVRKTKIRVLDTHL